MGAGLHRDVELETFLVVGEGSSDNHLERHYPIVLSLDLLYKPWKGLVFQIGPGIELEKNENLRLFRMGIEYEIEIGKHFDLSPTIFYDNRFNNYNTYTIAIGIGKSF